MKLLIIILTALIASVATYATFNNLVLPDHDHSEMGEQSHSGRTDSRGGHYDRSTGIYHFH